MSDRITEARLRAVMGRMSSALGAPDGPVWNRQPDGTLRATVGALVLQPGSKTSGNAWAISEIVNDGGGERTLLRGTTARELWDAAQAWLDGFAAAKGHNRGYY